MDISQTINLKKERSSNFELLRIIAMLFIVASHFAYYGVFTSNGTVISKLNSVYIDFLINLGKAGVNAFVLISGYFLVTSKFKIRKVLTIMFDAFLVALLLGLVFILCNINHLSLDYVKEMLFPSGGIWWFIPCYILLYLLSPFINLLIHRMNRKVHFWVSASLLFVWFLLPPELFAGYTIGNTLFFVTLYLVAGYIRLYDFKIKPWLGILIGVSSFAIWFTIKWLLFYFIGKNNGAVQGLTGLFTLANINNFVQVIATLLVFLSFKSIKMKNVKFINVLASTTLLIYLIHEFPYMRNLLWGNLFAYPNFISYWWFIPYSIGIILLVFSGCSLLGFIYQKTVGRLINKLTTYLNDKYLNEIDEVIEEVTTLTNEKQ